MSPTHVPNQSQPVNRATTMPLEVEVKYRVGDLGALLTQLESLGVRLGEAQLQSDHYFRHPVRDFATTDEALRIRTVNGRSKLTYKGPKLDHATKTRKEIELAMRDPDVEESLAEMLLLLGFSSATVVEKIRREGTLQYAGRTVVVAVDDLPTLGGFVELESMATTEDLEAAKLAVLRLADELGLKNAERRSYLELLLAQTAH